MCCFRCLSLLLREFREMPVAQRSLSCQGCCRLEANWVITHPKAALISLVEKGVRDS